MSAGKPLALKSDALPVEPTRDCMPASGIARNHAKVPLKISCHCDIDALREVWRGFQQRAFGSFYDTWEWNEAWQHCIGQAEGVSPRIILGHDEDDRLLFLLPLSVRRRLGCVVLSWLTAPTLNYGLGLYNPDFLTEIGGDLAAAWPEILRAAGPVDAVHLAPMPVRWQGRPHPLRQIFSARGANSVYVIHLDGDYEALYARKRSGESRRSAKKRDGRLNREGELHFGLPQTAAEAHRIIEAMFEQHAGRMGELGIGGAVAGERAFLHRLVDQYSTYGEGLAPFALTLDGYPLSVALGGVYGRAYYALILSMTDGPMRKHSPGDAVLRRTIEACSKAGLTLFDFGAGQADYKDAWADEVIPLYHALAASTLRGVPYVASASVANACKRRLKSSRRLWPRLRRLRRSLAGNGR
ncbi:GNAT family N-acetyltransferase [Rhodoligotrophos defluvii]|uniref:GNAT family N-acetyltransferase n=1 Tax=Rhodoligotrophos defluvii TaxID=2561934 RepID=UPI0010C93884|nr:GNAT family N-acetyltransferase [Rhodoligotrophos defluvii]